jgi:hypothetical protein
MIDPHNASGILFLVVVAAIVLTSVLTRRRKV